MDLRISLALTLLVSTFCLLSCSSGSGDGDDSEKVVEIEGKEYTKFEVEPVAMKYFVSEKTPEGMRVSSVILPEDWEKHTSGNYPFTGPDEMKISKGSGEAFSFSDDPQTLELYQYTGQKILEPKSMDELIDEVFVPNGKKDGMKLIKTYPLPQVAQFSEDFDGLLYKISLTPKVFDAVGTEWKDQDGTRYFVIISRYEETGPQAGSWGYSYYMIQSPKSNFGEAKRILISYIINQDLNYDWISQKNQELKQKIDLSNEAHRRMMADVKRNMDAFQEQHALRVENRRKYDNDVANYILGRTDVVNPTTGQKHKVTNQYQTYYWINDKGEYLTTNDDTWNPNDYKVYNRYHTWTRSQQIK